MIRGRRWVIAVVVVGLVAAGAAVVLVRLLPGGGNGGGSGGNGPGTSLATVQRRTLSTQTQFNGTLGYAGSYPVFAHAHGTLTWLPKVGQVVRQGQVLYRVNATPVVLLYGSTPAYRTLAERATAADMTGPDVAQLNHDLVALGYVRRSDVDSAWNEFSWATRLGVEQLQHHLRVDETGRLGPDDVVFLPAAARVTALPAALGGSAPGPVLQATSTRLTVTVALDAGLQSQVEPGDRVGVNLPNGSTTSGRVISVGTVATVPSNNSGGSAGQGGSGSGATVPVTIRLGPLDARDRLDQALVEVAITDRTVRDVLAVPVDALLARAGGGYAVEVVGGDRVHHLVPVSPGLFDDAAGMVQVSGAGLSAGQRVVVPGND